MRLKTLFNYSIVLLLTVLLLELSSLLGFRYFTGVAFEPATLTAQRQQRIGFLRKQIVADKSLDVLYSLHPYLGYSGRPGQYPWNERWPTFNNYGMLSVPGHSYPYKKKNNDFVIAVVGGSVAEGFANWGSEQVLQQTLTQLIPSFDRRVVIINLATGGYKQPQQLFHVQYSLLAGFEFDLVLNIDGLNELVATKLNSEQNINPLYPSVIHTGPLAQFYSGNRIDPITIAHLDDYYSAYRNELRLQIRIAYPLIEYSPFANLVGVLWSRHTEQRVAALKVALANDAARSMESDFRGPLLRPSDTYQYAAWVWMQASRWLNNICRANGLSYIHILQPNQYVAGSKVFSAEERQIALDYDSQIAQTVIQAYPYLIEQGDILKAQGIAFYDLTDVYKDTVETIYYDTCCHFGELGTQLLAQRIAGIIAEQWRQ